MTETKYLSVKSVAARYDVTRHTIYRWVDNGKLPPPKMKQPPRWLESELVEWEAKK